MTDALEALTRDAFAGAERHTDFRAFAATLGILSSSLAAERLAKFAQRTLIISGFVVTLAGIVLLLAFVRASSPVCRGVCRTSARPSAPPIAGTILVSVVALGTRSYAVAMVSLVVFGVIGLGAAALLPREIDTR